MDDDKLIIAAISMVGIVGVIGLVAYMMSKQQATKLVYMQAPATQTTTFPLPNYITDSNNVVA